MCGLLGWCLGRAGVERAGVDRLAALAAGLGRVMDMRGGDSWGWWSPDGAGDRGLGQWADGCRLPSVARHATVIGHTRLASAGAVTVANAHPLFEVGAGVLITLAHNGCLSNHRTLDALYGPRDVDSAHIAAALAADRDVSDCEGWGTWVWHDSRRPGVVQIARSGGSLAVGTLELPGEGRRSRRRLGVVWASTREALQVAARVSGLDVHVWAAGAVPDGRVLELGDGRAQLTRRRCELGESWESWESWAGSGAHGYSGSGSGSAWSSGASGSVSRALVVRRGSAVQSGAGSGSRWGKPARAGVPESTASRCRCSVCLAQAEDWRGYCLDCWSAGCLADTPRCDRWESADADAWGARCACPTCEAVTGAAGEEFCAVCESFGCTRDWVGCLPADAESIAESVPGTPAGVVA